MAASKTTKGTPFKNNGGDMRGKTDAHANQASAKNTGKMAKRKEGWSGRKFVACPETGST